MEGIRKQGVGSMLIIVIILKACMKIMMMITKMNKIIKINNLYVDQKSMKSNSEDKWNMIIKLSTIDQDHLSILDPKVYKKELSKEKTTQLILKKPL